MSRSTQSALGLFVAISIAAFAYRSILALELMGFDSYPMIAASRVSGVGDLLGTFGEELMDGRYPGGHFYRPVTSLSFALDHAIWGLDPFGYQLTNLLLLLLEVGAVFALVGRLVAPGGVALVATLAFALHPLQLETLPVAARRSDLLFSLFTLAALLAQPPAPLGESRAARWGAALCVLLAVASKETGAVALPVLLGFQLLLGPPGPLRERLARSTRRCAPAVATFALLFALRTAVLGGLGGHPESSLLSALPHGLAGAPQTLASLILPQPLLTSPVANRAVVLALLLAAAWVALTPLEGERNRVPSPGLPGFLGWWLVWLLGTTAISGLVASWYGPPFLPAYALFLGWLLQRTRVAVSGRRRLHAAIAVLTCLGLLGSGLRYAPILHEFPEWRELSGEASRFLARFRERVAAAPPGATVVIDGLPIGRAAPLERVGIRSALCMTDYSVQAYAELVFPERAIEVALSDGRPRGRALPDALRVELVPLPLPGLATAGSAGR